MSTKQSENIVSILAGADLSAALYKNVKLNGSGQVIVCSVAGEDSIGVLQNAPEAAGRPALVALHGSLTKVKCGGAVTAGAPFRTDAAGLAVAAAAASRNLGWVLETGANGRVVSCVLGSNYLAP